jgi:alanine dehydrogenase
MAEMTEEEADALDELWTKTTPKIKKGTGGVFTENRARMLLLDETTVRILDAQAKAARQTPSEFVTRLIRQNIAAAN